MFIWKYNLKKSIFTPRFCCWYQCAFGKTIESQHIAVQSSKMSCSVTIYKKPAGPLGGGRMLGTGISPITTTKRGPAGTGGHGIKPP